MDGTLSTNKKEATYKKIIFFQKDQKYQIEDYLNSKVLRSCLKTPCGPPQGSSKRSVRRAFFIG